MGMHLLQAYCRLCVCESSTSTNLVLPAKQMPLKESASLARRANCKCQGARKEAHWRENKRQFFPSLGVRFEVQNSHLLLKRNLSNSVKQGLHCTSFCYLTLPPPSTEPNIYPTEQIIQQFREKKVFPHHSWNVPSQQGGKKERERMKT